MHFQILISNFESVDLNAVEGQQAVKKCFFNNLPYQLTRLS